MEANELLIRQKAKEIRTLILQSLHAAGSGHLGGSLGMADVFATLYFSVLKHDPKNHECLNRDRLILSNGHIAPVLYASLAAAGYFPKEEMLTLRKIGSRLQGHPGKSHGLPGIEISSGSLGQGLSVCVGMALAAQLNQQKNRFYCLMGDGELQEGSIWEAAMSASHHRLANISAVVDRNFLQIDGPTESVMAIEPLSDKWKAFGWNVLQCNGHHVPELLHAFEQAKHSSAPSLIIANTIMGKGIPAIENNCLWHGKVPNDDEFQAFINVLNQTSL